VSHHQSVAVGRRFCGHPHADHAGDAAAIVDNNLLAQARSELLGDNACDRIDAAAGRKRHDQSDRMRRIGLRDACSAGRHERDSRRREKIQASHRHPASLPQNPAASLKIQSLKIEPPASLSRAGGSKKQKVR
jgi:hypothetical protein